MLSDHVALIRYGRVGSLIGKALIEAGKPFLAIEKRDSLAERIAADTVEAYIAQADEEVLRAANIAGARALANAIPNPFEASGIIETARRLNPNVEVVARAHSGEEVEHLKKLGAGAIVLAEREVAREMAARLIAPPTIAAPVVRDRGGARAWLVPRSSPGKRRRLVRRGYFPYWM